MTIHTAVSMPDIWGAGQLLAFSGLDGPVRHAAPFVLHTSRTLFQFDVKMPVSARIAFKGIEHPSIRLLLGDALVADSATGPFWAAFPDDWTLAGEAPESATMEVDGIPIGESPVHCAGKTGSGPALFAMRSGRRWLLYVERRGTGAPPADRNRIPATDRNSLLDERTRLVRTVPVPVGMDRGRERLLRKSVAVMKVNTCSAAGAIGRLWSTPDRWPHQHMWLWDSAFHAVGMVHCQPGAAQDFLLAMLEQTEPDGRLAHMIKASGERSQVTQPPVLAWAVSYVLERTGDQAWARACLPLLRTYLDWDWEHRDQNGNRIPEWKILDSTLCRCGESGADNSSVYDAAIPLDAPDFAGYLCNDYRCLADMATRLGQESQAAECRDRARRISDAVDEVLWCEGAAFYLHRDFQGRFVRAKTVAGFMPLVAGIPSRGRADRVRRHLSNPATFGAPFPVPSESMDSGTFCKDMWRGPTWINMNFLLFTGLRRYGFTEEAALVREKTLAEVQRWYERTGCIWEYYDALGATPPGELDRKQRLSSGNGIAPISDYHFTAALTVAFLNA